MDIIYAIIFALVFTFLGFFFGRLTACTTKPSGRLIVDLDHDEFFVAITDKPEDLVKKRNLLLKVYLKQREKTDND